MKERTYLSYLDARRWPGEESINRGNGELNGKAAGGDRGALGRLGSGREGEASKG